MGNEKSQPLGLIIEKNAIQADNFWTLHSASYGAENNRKVTVFVGSTETSGSKPSALERFSKNIMLNRHPNILKYVASWKINGQYHLATEEVRPLSQVLAQQTPLQLCIGLHSILKAVSFLHEKALSSHNNVCQAAIYVTPEGQWKLGGMEYLCRFNDVSAGYLSETRANRYERGISPAEETRVPQPPSAIDQYAFGILVEEVLLSKTADEVPGIGDFLDVCRRQLQATEISSRPTLSKLLQHNFFSHQFITIHSFLSELPLKAENEKQLFFRDLSNKLSEYSEEVVASQLGGLLLSRIVLLDNTAQQFLLPQILNPRNDERQDCIFSETVFKEHIVPRLMSIFCVRDAQVRLTILTHFKSFSSSLTLSQLQTKILPELLVGIKDTNDNLVSATLRALADLVPILGSATVIGGKRSKHFSDGRPKPIRHTKSSMKKGNKPIKPEPCPGDVREDRDVFLTERPSPDGGEAPSTESLTEEDESETWDNWDTHLPQLTLQTSSENVSNCLVDYDNEDNVAVSKSTSFTNLDKLDLKTIEVTQPSSAKNEEIDFFSDMEPVISKPCVLSIVAGDLTTVSEDKTKNKFDVSVDNDVENGWGNELEWADISDEPESPSKNAILTQSTSIKDENLK